MLSFASKTNQPDTKLGWNDRLGYGMGNFGITDNEIEDLKVAFHLED